MSPSHDGTQPLELLLEELDEELEEDPDDELEEDPLEEEVLIVTHLPPPSSKPSDKQPGCESKHAGEPRSH